MRELLVLGKELIPICNSMYVIRQSLGDIVTDGRSSSRTLVVNRRLVSWLEQFKGWNATIFVSLFILGVTYLIS